MVNLNPYEGNESVKNLTEDGWDLASRGALVHRKQERSAKT